MSKRAKLLSLTVAMILVAGNLAALPAFSPQTVASSWHPPCDSVCPDWWDGCRCNGILVIDCSGCFGFKASQTPSVQSLCAPDAPTPDVKAPAQPTLEGAAEVGSDT